jgi:S1-C subfamily serine protease
MRYLSGLVFILLLASVAAHAGDLIRDNVVKIYVTTREYDYFNPWQVQGRYNVEGSGAIINDHYIVTNAHLVSNSTFIQVKRTGQTKKYIAKLLFIAHESDLAILKVNNESFYPDTRPFDIGDLARVGDEIEVYGYPNWNEQLTVTRGIVSRVSHEHYVHSNVSLLTCQIDAAINPGNSGGPVVAGNRLIGIAMQMGQGENEGYVVPVPILTHFLRDIEDGSYDGIPKLGISYQSMDNPDMRDFYGMGEEQTGIYVRRVRPGSPAEGQIVEGDVILSIDGVRVANDGTVPFRDDERTQFNYIVQQRQMGERVTLEILRGGSIQRRNITLASHEGAEDERPDQEPTYYIFAGFIFMPLTEKILDYLGGWYDAPLNLSYAYYYGERQRGDEQIVFIMDVLSDEVNVGYEYAYYEIVSKVNGKKITRMEELVSTIQENRKPYHVIETVVGERIILDRKKARAARNRILKTYDIKHDRSRDLRGGR